LKAANGSLRAGLMMHLSGAERVSFYKTPGRQLLAAVV
jgi:hypothetical protein